MVVVDVKLLVRRVSVAQVVPLTRADCEILDQRREEADLVVQSPLLRMVRKGECSES
jgi:hypothetical protein